MKFEIDIPPNCGECVFCQEFIYCGLLYGEPLYPNIKEETDYDHRAKFCPFDSKEKWDEMHEGVKIDEDYIRLRDLTRKQKRELNRLVRKQRREARQK